MESTSVAEETRKPWTPWPPRLKRVSAGSLPVLNPRNIEPTVYPIQGECPKFQNYGNFMPGLPRHKSGAVKGAD